AQYAEPQNESNEDASRERRIAEWRGEQPDEHRAEKQQEADIDQIGVEQVGNPVTRWNLPKMRR
ncbi:hypothetical protein SB761_36125, partial [Pseudomonas sp. SIMBA_064]